MRSVPSAEGVAIPSERVKLEDELIELMRASRTERYDRLRAFLLAADWASAPEIVCLTLAEMVRATDRDGGRRVARSVPEHCHDHRSKHCDTCPVSRSRLLKAS